MSEVAELARRTSIIVGRVREQLVIPCEMSAIPIVTNAGRAVTVFNVLAEATNRWTFTSLSHEEILAAADVTVLADAMVERFNTRFQDGSAGRGVE